jgi:predicted Zn-dependent protease
LQQFILCIALCGSPLQGVQQKSLSPGNRPPDIAQSAQKQKRGGRIIPTAARGFTDRDQIRLGAALAARYDRERGIGPTVQSKQIESYLQAVADKLAARASRKLPYRIHYDPYPAFQSAFALPGGHIIFGGGILALMKTEDELAAVIAHEIIHVDERQVDERVTQIAKERNISPADLSLWKVEDFGPGYTKQQELACDSGGARLAVRAGYSPFGLLHLLQTFQLLAGPQTVETPQRATLADRISQIKDEIRTNGWEGLTKERPLELP